MEALDTRKSDVLREVLLRSNGLTLGKAVLSGAGSMWF